MRRLRVLFRDVSRSHPRRKTRVPSAQQGFHAVVPRTAFFPMWLNLGDNSRVLRGVQSFVDTRFELPVRVIP